MFNFINIFKRNKVCNVCGVNTDSTDIVGYDPTNRDKFKDNGVKQDLCLIHLEQQWATGLKNFLGFSVCFLPQKGWNSYSYITLEHASEWNLGKDEIINLNDVIDQYGNKTCAYCKEISRFILFNRIYNLNEVLLLKTKPVEVPQSLCSLHFYENIINEIRDKKLTIDEITPPYGDRGIYMQGEY